ncbi:MULTISPECIES: HNH endonuclease [unclassified Curtobacterium]
MDDAEGALYVNLRPASEAWKSVRAGLEKAQFDKCGWCESPFDDVCVEVDHIRPKGARRYWWLAFELSNLLAACRSCNNKKRAKWPLLPGGERLSPRQFPPMLSERPAIVDPTVEDPEPHFDLQNLGGRWRIVGRSNRGQRTVEVLALDRDRLSNKLSFHLDAVVRPCIDRAQAALVSGNRLDWEESVKDLARFCAVESPYSAMTTLLVKKSFA